MEDKEVEKGLLTFYSSLKKLGEDKEFLEVIKDLKVAWDLLNKFFEIHREKIKEIKIAIDLWQTKDIETIGQSSAYIKEVPDINKQLNSVLEKILKELEYADQILYSSLLNKERIQEGIDLKKKIEICISQVKENMDHLKYLYKRQNKELKSKTPGQIKNDLKKYTFLHRLFSDELATDNKLKINIINMIRIVQFYLGKLEKKRQVAMSRLRIEEIHYNKSSDIKYFYENIMKIYFPDPSELDPIETYVNSIFRRYRRDTLGYEYFHVLILKAGPEIVGMWLMDFLGDEKKNNCLGIIWFTAIKEEYRNQGFKMFMEESRRLLVHDKEVGGYKNLVGAFFEVENLEKVPHRIKKKCRRVMHLYHKRWLERTELTKEDIEHLFKIKPKDIKKEHLDKIPIEIIDLYLKARERRFRQLGAKKVDIEYIQPQLDEDIKPVHYLNLYLYPMMKEWQKEIPGEEFLKIYDITWEGYCAYESKNKKGGTYQTMVKRIKEKKIIKLV